MKAPSGAWNNVRQLWLGRLWRGLLVGRKPHLGKLRHYDGPAHLVTVAPTRASKGVGTVIPNLLTAERSVLVIDPNGENAKIAGAARKRFGAVHILAPFGVTSRPSSAYNPLGRLDANSLDLDEDAASLTEALVMDPHGQSAAIGPDHVCGGA
ncbi:type IV secretory system conjugative DNA transfer family protein [Pseudorhodobacter sp. W20_MBD10_FR17]|uniref:type IV secretory system conjugative DNA transfer family protein n=1 Tax=Pseudorhodobacter sp. W20_MBD10_FR17 TaxID=3240266 RepID=UPI003F95BE47